ncbi:hypothetical protein [Undibacterium luofuense]|jgi:hypothetical protein
MAIVGVEVDINIERNTFLAEHFILQQLRLIDRKYDPVFVCAKE